MFSGKMTGRALKGGCGEAASFNRHMAGPLGSPKFSSAALQKTSPCTRPLFAMRFGFDGSKN